MGEDDMQDPMATNIQIVEMDVFAGAAKLLRELRQMYPAMSQDEEWQRRLKYTMDLCNNCIYQFWEMQQLRLALHKGLFSDGLNPGDPEDTTKH